MKLRCWPGAIAWINDGHNAPENVGALVDVESYLGVREFPCGPAPAWMCRAVGRVTVGWDSQAAPIFARKEDRLMLRDADLTPILPPPHAHEVDRQIDEFVEAVENLAHQLERAQSAS